MINSLYRLTSVTGYNLVLLGLLALETGCSSPPKNTKTNPQVEVNATRAHGTTKFDQRILSSFADKVVIPTHQEFAKKAQELSQAIETFVKSPDEKTLHAAQAAWVATRSPWEQTECFGFGPAKSLGYDSQLDTWPINETDLNSIVKGADPLTADYMKKLKENEKGFHVIEYLLFAGDKTGKVPDFSKRELDYLQLLGKDFAKIASKLSDSWSKGVDGKPAYREVIATAGENSNNNYPTVQAGVEEIVGGMIDSLTEVADSKIGKAFEKKDSNLAESRFSLNTLTDMQHNIKGSQNVYLGSFIESKVSDIGLSAYIAKVNPALDQKVKRQFQASTDALHKISQPFEKSVVDPQQVERIKAAQEAVKTLSETIEKEVKPLVISK